MLCRCTPESTAEADTLRAEVRNRLTADGRDVTDGNFLTHVVVSLNWDYNARITGIINDMWSLVTVEHWTEDVSVSVECDDVEDGIAAIWKAFADEHTRARRTSNRLGYRGDLPGDHGTVPVDPDPRGTG